MLDIPSTIAAGGVSMMLLEGIKYLIRLFTGKPVNFPPVVYAIGVPVLNVLVIPLLALIGFEGYEMPTDWQAFGLAAVRVLIASLISWGGYATGLKPLKNYARSYAAEKLSGYTSAGRIEGP